MVADVNVFSRYTRAINPNRGDHVRMVANVTASDRDETFGFFKRPRKAEITTPTTI
jgi:hypothetical protein